MKNIINNPQIIVGDYIYYDDPDDIYNFEKRANNRACVVGLANREITQNSQAITKANFALLKKL